MARRITTNDNLTRGERLQIMLSPDELSAVDDYRFQHRMPSRAAAVRELFRLGLASAAVTQAAAGRKSSDFGVLGQTSGEPGAPMPSSVSKLNE